MAMLKGTSSEAIRKSCKEPGETHAMDVNSSITGNNREVLVLHAASYEQELQWWDLPSDILMRIIAELELEDVFTLTLVNKRLKSCVYCMRHEPRNAHIGMNTCSLGSPHCLTTLSKAWISNSLVQSFCQGNGFAAYLNKQDLKCRLSLLQWYVCISENLQSLIIDQHISIISISQILQNCPNLKFLSIGNNHFHSTTAHIIEVNLPHLEVFIQPNNLDFDGRRLTRNILLSALKLEAFSGNLMDSEWAYLFSFLSHKGTLTNLRALDLYGFTSKLLAVLSEINGLKLQYLKLGKCGHVCAEEQDPDDYAKIQMLCHKLLAQQRSLRILMIESVPGVSLHTLKLITSLRLKLQFACLSVICTKSGAEGMEHQDINNDQRLDLPSFLQFKEMLLSHNPQLDLSNIIIYYRACDVHSVQAALKAGFHTCQTFLDNYRSEIGYGLQHVEIRRLLNLIY